VLFYCQKSVSDFLSILRFIKNPDDDVLLKSSILAALKGVGDKIFEIVQEFAVKYKLSL
jgi:superfamily I DNA/RNA helicase